MNYTKTTLDNGLRVITVPMRDNPTVTVLVLVEAGSKYETKEKNGISHFLEHMCFKGTARRPNAHAIASELDGLGSQYNAFTSQEYTGYYAKSDAKHFKQIFDLVSDIYLNSTFPEPEMQKEKGVIVEEINMYEDMPNRHVQDLFMSLLYGDQPAGWNIAGTRENVRAMTREDFIAYKAHAYVPEATTVIVSGNVEESVVADEVARIFGALAPEAKASKEKTRDIQMKPELLVSYKKSDQTHLVLGFRTFDMYDKRISTASILSAIIGGGMSSRLFIKLREELGVAYYVRASNDNYTDHGAFTISAGVAVDRVAEVVSAILAECKRLRTELVEESELSKVKEYLAGNMKLELESSDAWGTYYGAQEIVHYPIETLEESEAKLRAVTREDVQALAETIFTDAGLNLALIGPYEDGKQFASILTLE